MSAHTMKHPLDLDPFHADQIEGTRRIDENGPRLVIPLIAKASHLCSASLALLSAMPLEVWQRAAYESAVMAQKPDCDHGIAAMSEVLWQVVVFLQEGKRLTSERMKNDPVCREHFQKERGFDPLSMMEEE